MQVDKKARGVIWVQFQNDDIGRNTRAFIENKICINLE